MPEILTLGAFGLVLIVCLSFDITIIVALLFGLLCFLTYGLIKGFGLKQLLTMSASGLKTGLNVMVILLLIGVLTASWRISGTIPYLVVNSVQLIPPAYCLVFTFILNAAFSMLLGTAFGTSATMGIVTMTVCNAVGLDPIFSGGAILAGVYVGDRGSPVSSSAQLVAAVTRTDIYENVKWMMFSSWIPFIASCLIYLAVGLNFEVKNFHLSLQESFSKEFFLSAWSLIPAVIMIVLIFFKVNIKKSISASVLTAIAIAFLLQERSWEEVLQTLWSGYTCKNSELATMMDGGGLTSILTVVVIIFISCTYSGLFEGTGLIASLKSSVERLSKKTSSFAAILLTAIVTALISCNQVLTIILTRQICKDIQPDKQKMAISLENSAVLIPALIPWSIAGAVPVATIGAPASCIIAAFFLYLVPLWVLLTFRIQRKFW